MALSMMLTSQVKIHEDYMRYALTLAGNSPPKPSNFRVGALLVDEDSNSILSTGYTLELPGNTHAEQCCLQKFAEVQGTSEQEMADFLPRATAIYTTMEPCWVRLSGNLPCVDRILKTKSGKNGGVKRIYHGIREPETFVGQNNGRSKLEAAGIECIHIPGFEENILKMATAGHKQEGKPDTENTASS